MWQASKQAPRSRAIFAALTGCALLAMVAALPASAAEVKAAAPAASAPAVPMTIGDFIELQRKAMESDLASKNAAANPGGAGQVPAPATTAPIAVVPAVKTASIAAGAISVQQRPARPPEPSISVTGVASFGGQWFAEVQTQTGSKLMRQGERVYGTPWTVSAVQPNAATLVRPGTLDDLPPESDDSKAGKAKAKKHEPRPAPGPVVRRFTFDKNVL